MVHQKQGAHNNESLEKWLVGQAVKTPASHAGNAGSIPARVTRKSTTLFNDVSYERFCINGIEPERVFALRKQSGGLFLAKSGEHL